jgi:hypothetical protein
LVQPTIKMEGFLEESHTLFPYTTSVLDLPPFH